MALWLSFVMILSLAVEKEVNILFCCCWKMLNKANSGIECIIWKT